MQLQEPALTEDDDGVSAPPVRSPETATAEIPAASREVVFRRTSGWRTIDFGELYIYRDLFRFLTWRSIKARYAQSAIGIGWAVIQPLFQVLVFTVVFGTLAGLKGEGGRPYSLVTFVAIVAWTYFSAALTDGTNSLMANTSMISKVYFPRLLLPLSAVVSKLIDFFISLVLLIVMMLCWYHVVPTWNVIWLPLLIALMILSAAGPAIWFTALAVQFRDVKYAMPFLIQLMMYVSPVIYSTDRVPERFDLGGITSSLSGLEIAPRLIYAVNPLVGVIEGFRAAFLGTGPMPWDYLAIGTVSAVMLAITGCLYFRSRERLFADVA
jgi:lipopolysaccharide transport system permease protein